MEIFWSPWYTADEHARHELIYDEPDPLVRELLRDKDATNIERNYMSCPAFLRSMTNLYVWRNPVDVNVRLQQDRFIPMDAESQIGAQFFSYAPSSRTIRKQIKYYTDVIFFSADPVMISSFPAFMHHTHLQTRVNYIPGGFDISKWFRPVEGQFELVSGFDELQFRRGDPLLYLKFETSEQIKLTRFKMTPEIYAVSRGCIRYKNYRPFQSLSKIYDVFCESNTDDALLNLIRDASQIP